MTLVTKHLLLFSLLGFPCPFQGKSTLIFLLEPFFVNMNIVIHVFKPLHAQINMRPAEIYTSSHICLCEEGLHSTCMHLPLATLKVAMRCCFWYPNLICNTPNSPLFIP